MRGADRARRLSTDGNACRTLHDKDSAMNRLRTRLDSSDSGFTLIELLIVIVVLGILSGIAIFAVSSFRDDATTACQTANTRIDATNSAARAANPSGSYGTTGTRC